MATRRFDSYKVKIFRSFIFSLKVGFFLNLFVIFLSFISVSVASLFYVSGDYKSKPLGSTINLLSDFDNNKIDFDYLVIENYQRNRNYKKANQLIQKCVSSSIPCYNHRLNLSDYKLFHHNPYFYIDDWWLNNCKYSYIKGWDLPLKFELSKLPSGSILVINEHRFNSIDKLIPFVMELQYLNPQLRIVLGVQIHLQWFDPAFFRKLHIINQINKSGLNWMISEFSVYDRLYKPWKVYDFDRYIPIQIRRSFQQHQAYWISRQCGRSSSCSGFTLWAPNRGAWFRSNLSDFYDGQFIVSDRDQPTPLYWAIRRGLSN